MRWVVAMTVAVLMIGAAMGESFAGGSYDPIPSTWSVHINLPGRLGVGARYCTQSGQCKTVGDEIRGFAIGGVPVGGVQGCQTAPETPTCLNAALPVQILAQAPSSHVVIVRLDRVNYSVSPQWWKQEADGQYLCDVCVQVSGKWMPMVLAHFP